VLEPESWPSFEDDGPPVESGAETAELLGALKLAVSESLTQHQRSVFTALALNEVPIDVLAERMDTTRGALYKTLHDARTKLRAELVAAGHMEEVTP
jgi:RNA polymerase sigma-70 factor (ECF subfamily)